MLPYFPADPLGGFFSGTRLPAIGTMVDLSPAQQSKNSDGSVKAASWGQDTARVQQLLDRGNLRA